MFYLFSHTVDWCPRAALSPQLETDEKQTSMQVTMNFVFTDTKKKEKLPGLLYICEYTYVHKPEPVTSHSRPNTSWWADDSMMTGGEEAAPCINNTPKKFRKVNKQMSQEMAGWSSSNSEFVLYN